jgi:hypothetical protein
MTGMTDAEKNKRIDDVTDALIAITEGYDDKAIPDEATLRPEMTRLPVLAKYVDTDLVQKSGEQIVDAHGWLDDADMVSIAPHQAEIDEAREAMRRGIDAGRPSRSFSR